MQRRTKSMRQPSPKIIFITGTDTGVGKTIFTSLFVQHLRTAGVRALAMKPFCSGGRGDVRLLRAAQENELSENEINPFYFPEPVAPLISARLRRRKIRLDHVLSRIQKTARQCECLLIEGSGGLLVPLGEKYFVSDLIQRLRCEVVVVSRNRLGTINHTLLTVKALENAGVKKLSVAFVEQGKKDRSAATNRQILEELLAPIPVRLIPFLGQNTSKIGVLKKSHKILKKTLAQFFI